MTVWTYSIETMDTSSPVRRCACGSLDFRPVEVDRGPHRPLYRTEFEACLSCGAMFHRRTKRTLMNPMGPLDGLRVQQPSFRPEVDTSDWEPPPAKVRTDEP
jgi:hypothetical protein